MDPFARHFALALVAALIAGVPSATFARPIPPPGNYRPDHYAHSEFDRLLARHASRAKVRRELLRDIRKVYTINSKAEFVALHHEVPPSERALILLEHWPRALFAGLIDDVRVLACFDSRDRLVVYELF
jgi:hypothetical protein